MIVGIDIDNVFLDTQKLIDSFKDKSNEKFIRYMKENDDKVLPKKYAIQSLIKLHSKYNAKIIFITARPHLMYNDTVKTLDKFIKNKFPYKLITTDQKSKEPYIKNNKLDFYVDDSPNYVLDAFKHVKIAFFMKTYKYNKIPNFGKIRNIVIINDLNEMVNIIENFIKK